MKGDISFSILSKEDGIRFIHEKNFFKLVYMAMSHCLQPENQVIEREEESCENLRSNCLKKKTKKCKIRLSYTLASSFEYLLHCKEKCH